VSEDDSGTWIKRRQGADTLHVRTCRLEVVSGPDRGASRVFTAPQIVIGRAHADFQLEDRRVSALHAEIRLENDGYRLRDLGSTNGTHVGGLRVVDAYILANTTIAVGDSVVRFTPLPASVELPLSQATRLGGLVGSSPVMRRLYEVIERLAATEATVLVTGETGAGKELVARAVHDRSARREGPFVVLDCGALPEQLIEDIVFGHEVGAFTGATTARPGVFEAAHGGTLFLDEIGEIPLELQPKLLRVLEAKQVRRIGGLASIDCNVRIVAATNRDLAAEVNRDAFRADLYFRIAVARIHVPPLREHREDIDELIAHCLVQLGAATLPETFNEWARKQSWPGNVRELRGAIEQSLALARHPEMIARQIQTGPSSLEIDVSVPFKEAKKKIVEELERRYITELLDAHQGNVSAAARAADLDRMTIYKMLYRAGLRDKPE
jgi:transcriptional regulator with PAS, ATPase and Fis domain